MIGRPSYGILDLADYKIGESSIALSLRKLNSLYTGYAVRVRRSSDNAEQDIGFLGNDFDVASATAFASGYNLYVTTWYTQLRVGIQFIQNNINSQPKLILGGTKPTILFDGIDDFLFGSYNAQIFGVNKPRMSIIIVNSSNAYNAGSNNFATLYSTGSVATSDFFIPFRKNGSSESIQTRHSDGVNSITQNWSGTGNAFTTAINVHSYIDDGSVCALRTKGVVVQSGVTTNLTSISDISTQIDIGHTVGSVSSYWYGNIYEVIVLPHELNTETVGLIEQNIITYYAIS